MGIRLLVIDDNILFREIIPKLFAEHSNIEVVGCLSAGENVSDKLEEFVPDVVLIDIQKQSGINCELIRQLKSKNPNLPIMVFTTQGDRDVIANCLEQGASGYLLKFTSYNELVLAIQAVQDGNSYFHPSVAKMIISEILNPRKSENVRIKSPEGLTERETEVLKHIASGLTNSEIAAKLFISVKTVKTHRKNLMEKLQLHDRLDIYKYALKHGLIGTEEDQ